MLSHESSCLHPKPSMCMHAHAHIHTHTHPSIYLGITQMETSERENHYSLLHKSIGFETQNTPVSR